MEIEEGKSKMAYHEHVIDDKIREKLGDCSQSSVHELQQREERKLNLIFFNTVDEKR